MQNTQPIGMFDSGIGGLTVMKQLMHTLPHENVIYFGDTERIPYGEKGRETIIRYSIENTMFLMNKNIKMLVIPCNTSSAYSLQKLQQTFNIPIIGVIEPGAERVAQVTKNNRIAVLATKGTIRSGVFQHEIQKRLPNASVFPIACPLLVPLIEEQFLSHAATRLIVQEYLQPLKQVGIDTLLLGCTHYPLLRDLIQQEMGPHVTIVDSAKTCVDAVHQLLQKHGLQSSTKSAPDYQYFVSEDPESFHLKACHFLGNEIPKVQLKT